MILYDTDLLNAETIGAGDFGKVYLLQNGLILKGVNKIIPYQEILNEFNKHTKIYDSLEKLYNFESDDEFIQLIKKYITVPKPICCCEKNITINNDQYSSYIIMSKLNGLPIKFYKEFDSESLNKFEKDFLIKKGDDFQVMLHLSFNLLIPGGFYTVGHPYYKINDINPPRGYYINEHPEFLDGLRNKYNLELSNNQIKKIMSFIYGWILYDTHIVPIDIEFALGYYDGNFKINVFDFGFTFDINNYEYEKKTEKHDIFYNIINEKYQENEKFKKIIKEAKILIYSDIYDNSWRNELLQNTGFYLAKIICEKH